ncbi:transposase [Sphingomonas mollis]|uniref:transposase n=1 Tax=Sphingomonas mollis TaxID=2795726 RepID=UPI003A0FBD0C
MPGLGRIASRQVTALACLAPFDRQSGTTSRPGRCSGGRPAVRRCFHLAALIVARSGKGPLAATASRLRAAGKPYKLAIVATMRKLFITLSTIVKNNTEYRSAQTQCPEEAWRSRNEPVPYGFLPFQ